MEWGTLAGLAGLALIDSGSIGTMLIPLWIMLDPRINVRQLLVYLGTVAGFYFVVGVLLALGAGTALDLLAPVTDHPATRWVQLGIGLAMCLAAIPFAPKRIQARRRVSGKPEPVDLWMTRLDRARASYRTMAGLGLFAALLEVAAMVPYLAAVGVITAADVAPGVRFTVLAGYTLVMITPALIILGIRLLVRGDRAMAVLAKLSRLIAKNMDGVLSSSLIVLGFLIALDAARRLFW